MWFKREHSMHKDNMCRSVFITAFSYKHMGHDRCEISVIFYYEGQTDTQLGGWVLSLSPLTDIYNTPFMSLLL